MVQGGDPTGTGKGGESVWGGAFADEIVPQLRHHKRGVVSMANSGKDTNKCVRAGQGPWELGLPLHRLSDVVAFF